MLGEPWARRGDAGQAGALLWACSSVGSQHFTWTSWGPSVVFGSSFLLS